MNFGKGILVAFILFAGFIGTLAWLSFQEDHSLVSNTYYRDEMSYSKKLDNIENAMGLKHPPSFKIVGGELRVHFNQWSSVESGFLKVMRPSEVKLDARYTIQASSDSLQIFPLEVSKKGLYRVSMSWHMDGKEYHYERKVSM